MPSFSTTGTFTVTRAQRHPAVVRAFVLQYRCESSSRTGPQTLPELAANGRRIFTESAAVWA
jgi:hypothetical protein